MKKIFLNFVVISLFVIFVSSLPVNASLSGSAPKRKSAAVAGRQSYSISQDHKSPNFTNAVIDPEDVKLGQKQTMTVALTDERAPITQVVAEIQTDTGMITKTLKRISGTDKKGVWEGSWIVKDTHDTIYTTTFKAVNKMGEKNEVRLSWTDPSCIEASTTSNAGIDLTLNTSCTTSAIDGPDGGRFTVGSGGSVTVAGSSVLSANDLLISGGSLLKNNDSGAISIVSGGVICMTDVDSDGYPLTTTLYADGATCNAGRRRRSLMTSTTALDCNDGLNTVYQNLEGYADADGDLFTVAGPPSSVCSGASLPSGYLASVSNPTDVNDNQKCAAADINSTVGSAIYNTTCQKCSSGARADQLNNEDLWTQCTTGGNGTATSCRSPNCSGSGASCGYLTAASTCRTAAGACDVADTCPGGLDTCSTDVFQATNYNPGETCQECTGTGAAPILQASNEDLWTQCSPVAAYCDVLTAWTASSGNCNGSGACSTGSSSVCSGATGCNKNACNAGVCSTPYADNGTDPNTYCPVVSAYCNGLTAWTASSGNCNGSGACSTGSSSVCSGATACYTNACNAGVCSTPPAGAGTSCTGTDYCSGSTRYYNWQCNGGGSCLAASSQACTTAGTCQTGGGCAYGSCVSVSNVTAYNEGTGCYTTCTGCNGSGSCVNITNNTTDTWGANLCNATHYVCGSGSCSAPTQCVIANAFYCTQYGANCIDGHTGSGANTCGGVTRSCNYYPNLYCKIYSY